MRRLLVLASLGAMLVVTARAGAVNCFSTSVKDKLEGADIAFVGHVASVRPVRTSTGIATFDYTFGVDHAVKGALGSRVTLRAAELEDIDNQVVTPAVNVAIGVLGTRAKGRLVTSTCSLVDPGALMGASDDPKGGGIKVVIGLILLGLVFAYSWRRLKRRQALSS